MKLRKINEAINISAQIVRAGKEPNTKLSLAHNNHNLKKYKKISDDFNEKLEEKRLDLALVGDIGEVLYDEKQNYLFSKEGIKELTKYQKELLDTDYEFEFYTLDFNKLTNDEKSLFCKLDEDGEFISYDITHDEEKHEILGILFTNLPEFKIDGEK